jgi:hypothetical protein
MRDIVEFTTGPDGSLILAPTPGAGYDYADLDVELNGKTVQITTPEGNQPVALEIVHGDRE